MPTVEELEKKLLIAEEKNEKLDEKAKRFEGQLTDVQKKLERFTDIDIEKLKADSDALKVLEREKDGIPQDKFDNAVEEAIKEQRTEWQTKLEASNKLITDLTSKVTDFEVVGTAMSDLSSKLKDDPITKPFIENLLRQNLKKEGESLIVYHGDEKVFSKQDISKPMEAKEYYGIIQEQYPSAFTESAPAGTKNNNERVGGKVSNQGLLERAQDPEAAKSLDKDERAKASNMLYKKYRPI